MKITFNPSGTHVHKQVFKIRFDLIPDLTDKTYLSQHVYVVDETSAEWLKGYKGALNPDETPKNQAAYDTWLDSLPHIWRTNPALCWFIQIPEMCQLPDLETYLASLLNKDTIATLDNYLVLPDSAHYISPFTRTRPKFTAQKILTSDIESLKVAVNSKFLGWGTKPLEGGGTVQVVQRQSITIGAGATNRASAVAVTTTIVDRNVTATGTGTIDTWELWFNTGGTAVEVATFYIVSGTNLSTRDNEAIGAVTSGSKQTFATLSTDVTLGDFPGFYGSGGNIEQDTSGTGYYYKSGDNIPCTNAAFTALANRTASIYGTGLEAGGGWAGEVCGVAVAEFDGVVPAEITGV